MELSTCVPTGETVTFSKTLTEFDLCAFAAISGDFDPLHMDERHAGSTRFQGRIAHGILSMALLSTVAWRVSELARSRGFTGTSVSLGFDRIRFVRPVRIGATLTAVYAVGKLDPGRARTNSPVQVLTDEDEPCVVGEHVMKWLAGNG